MTASFFYPTMAFGPFSNTSSIDEIDKRGEADFYHEDGKFFAQYDQWSKFLLCSNVIFYLTDLPEYHFDQSDTTTKS